MTTSAVAQESRPVSSGAYRQESLVAAYAVTWLALLLVVRPTGILSSVVNASYFGIGLITLREQWLLSRDNRWDARTRSGWRWLAISSAWMWLGGAIWTAALAAMGTSAHPLWSAVADLAYIPFAIIGFLTLPAHPGVSLRDRGVRMDALLFALGMVALSWHFAVRPRLDNPALAGNAMGITLAVGEWLVAAAAAMAYIRAADPGMRRAIAIALVAQLLYIFSDYYWVQLGGSYLPGNAVDGIWFTAWLLRYSAVRAARRATPTGPRVGATYQGGIAPAAFVGGAYTLLLLSVQIQPERVSLDIALAATAMTGLLLLRQRLSLTENRRLARQTAQQAARFRSLVSHATDYVMILDDRHHVMWASPSAERTLGILPGERLVDRIDDEDRERILSWLVDRPAVSPPRCRMRTAGGEWSDIELRAHDRRADPHVGGVVLNGRDVSEELALEGRVGHVRKLGTLSDMAGRIAHSFNNALAVLQGHAELLAQALPLESPSRESAREVQAAAERGAGITRQLLGFSGRHVIRPEVIEAGVVLRELRPSLAKLLNSSVKLTIDAATTGLGIRVDRAQFDQVLANLVANARDAMPEGGEIIVAVVAEEGPPPTVRLSVRDHGTGIPAELRDRIFEPFFTTKEQGQGTGLGLAMVESIVHRAGGHVDVESGDMRGTTFTVVLPRVIAAPPLPAPSVAALSTTAGARILLVDDEPGVRHVARRMLERVGHRVFEAGSGDEAVAMMADLPDLDLLVSDLMMPGMPSREMIARFQRERPGVPVICISGFAAEQEHSPLGLSVHTIVAKPFVAATLLDAVTNAIAARQVPSQAPWRD